MLVADAARGLACARELRSGIVESIRTSRRCSCIEGADALDLIPAYEPHVHAFLLDSGRPSLPVAELGGTGRTHDWTVSRRFVAATSRPVFLAGGLKAANVGEAIATVQPWGVDVSSGVESERGRKDIVKIREFIGAVRAAETMT